MLEQAIDFRDESERLYELLKDRSDADFARPTLFKNWTPNDVIGHLHIWNRAADLSLVDEPAFVKFLEEIQVALRRGLTHPQLGDEWLKGVGNRELLETWREYYLQMAGHWVEADPKKRLKWAGPDMSARSSITARLMETWSHGQAVYDLFGVERRDADRIKNVARIGTNTYGWTFVNRGLEPPADVPSVCLQLPSGEIWEQNEPNEENCIAGLATEFCQVVTQTRNIADTSLKVIGETATRWMSIAQCFAGPPEDPPPPGSRHRQG